jgi:hypothetical protein
VVDWWWAFKGKLSVVRGRGFASLILAALFLQVGVKEPNFNLSAGKIFIGQAIGNFPADIPVSLSENIKENFFG